MERMEAPPRPRSENAVPAATRNALSGGVCVCGDWASHLDLSITKQTFDYKWNRRLLLPAPTLFPGLETWLGAESPFTFGDFCRDLAMNFGDLEPGTDCADHDHVFTRFLRRLGFVRLRDFNLRVGMDGMLVPINRNQQIPIDLGPLPSSALVWSADTQSGSAGTAASTATAATTTASTATVATTTASTATVATTSATASAAVDTSASTAGSSTCTADGTTQCPENLGRNTSVTCVAVKPGVRTA